MTEYVWKAVTELLKVSVTAFFLFMAGFLGASYLGFDETRLELARMAPAAVLSDEKLEGYLVRPQDAGDSASRAAFIGSDRETDVKIETRGWHVSGIEPAQAASWTALLGAADAFYTETFGRVFFPRPLIAIRELHEAEGQYNGWSILLDPRNPFPLVTLFHEMTHVYLFWSLFPGLPFDCPRWFNEGMAEWVSYQLTGFGAADAHEIMPMAWQHNFQRLSPLFSQTGTGVETQARLAFSYFLKIHGWEGVQRMFKGLGYARPFHSVYYLNYGKSVEEFGHDCDFFLTDQYALATFSPAVRIERLSRLLGTPSQDRVFELCRLLLKSSRDEGLETLFLGLLMERVHLALAERKKDLAIGWFAAARPYLAPAEFADFLAELRANTDDPQTVTAPLPEVPTRRWFPGVAAGWLLVGALVLIGFRRARNAVKARLVWAWSPDCSHFLPVRWLVVGAIAWWGPWFARFFLIGLPAYAGLEIGTEQFRILAAEHLAVVFWIAIFVQLKIWDCGRVPTFPRREMPEEGFPFTLELFVSWGFFLVAVFTTEQSIQHSPFPAFELILTHLGHLNVLLAGNLLIWGTARRWYRLFPGGSAGAAIFPPVLIFTILRADPGFSPVMSGLICAWGWRLAQWSAHQAPMSAILLGDAVIFFPWVCLIPFGFVRCDPVGGLFRPLAIPGTMELFVAVSAGVLGLIYALQARTREYDS
jgi:hypothetical protein